MKSLRTPEHLRLIALLVAARGKAGLTQQQLADRLGKPQSFVAKYEGGERRLDLVEFMTIARTLQFDWAGAVRELEAEYGPIVGSVGNVPPDNQADNEPDHEPDKKTGDPETIH